MSWHKLLLAAFAMLVVVSTGSAEEPLSAWQREQALKARIIHGFLKFTRWQGVSQQEFSVCVIGDKPELLKRLRSFFLAKKNPLLAGKRVTVVKADSSQVAGCQMLFISKLEPQTLSTLLIEIESLPILTFSDTEGFAQQGVHVNFFVYQNQIRFEINHEAVLKAGLQLDSKLLSYAKIVKGVRT